MTKPTHTGLWDLKRKPGYKVFDLADLTPDVIKQIEQISMDDSKKSCWVKEKKKEQGMDDWGELFDQHQDLIKDRLQEVKEELEKEINNGKTNTSRSESN